MKILFVVEHFPCLSETFVLNQVTGLLDLGHDVEIYAVGRPSGDVVHPDVQAYRLLDRTWSAPSIPRSKFKRILEAVRCFPKLLSRCGARAFRAINPIRHGKDALNLKFFYTCLPLLEREGRYDAIHCHFGDKGLPAEEWRKMGLLNGSLSVVFHAHELAGLSDAEGKRMYGPLFRSDVLLLPISDRWRLRLNRWGAEPSRNKVHHMGIDLAKFSFAPRACPEGQTIRILSVGRFTEQKGYPYALRAVARVIKVLNKSVCYTIVGSGEMKEELIELVRELGIEKSVVFMGGLPQSEVIELIAQAHVFLLPSVTASNGFQEGIPVAIMEAMACGLPVVSTIHSGIPELIDDGESGCLSEEKDFHKLADDIAMLQQEPQVALSIADAARQKVEAEFSLTTLNIELEHVLQRAV